jgi:arylsulfatase A-like enzyme
MSRTLSIRTLRRIPLAAGFLASAVLAQESRPRPGGPAAAPAQNGLELLLDRIASARITSPLVDLSPLAARVVDLDASPPETTLAAESGALRIWRLPLPVRRDEAAAAAPPSLTDPAGQPAGDDVKLSILPAHQEVALAELPVFAEQNKKRSPEGERYVVVDAPLDATFEIARCGAPLRCTFVAKRFSPAAADDPAPPSPEVTIAVDGEPVGELMVVVEDKAVFELPPKSGTSKVTVKVAGATTRRGGIVLLQSFALDAADGFDRAAVTAPAGRRDLRLRYLPAPPRALVTLFDVGDGHPAREVAREVMLLAGGAAIVAGTPQPLEVELDGGAPVATRGRAQELPFTVPGDGVHRLVVRSAAASFAGRVWLVQPRALLLPIRQPELAALSESSPVRGCESRDGSPLVRHVMIDDDTRRSLLSPPATSAEFKVEVAAGAKLEFSLGLVALQKELPKTAVEVEVTLATADGRNFRLFGEAVRERGKWMDHEVALPANVAGAATLRIATRGDARGPTSARDVLAAIAEPTLLAPAPVRRPNLIIYLVDTLRADHCSPFGYARPTTPEVGRIASEGLLFESAFSQAPWTRPSVATLFTSRLYSFHGAGKTTGLSPDLTTIAERMRSAGYATAGFIANAHVHGSSLNFEQGFSRFDAVEKGRRRGTARANDVHAAALAWLEANTRRPFFLYVHTIDPHAPYDPPKETAGVFGGDYQGPITADATVARNLTNAAPLPAQDLQHVVDLYDEEILFNDRALGSFVDKLHDLGVWDDTLFVFLSDHGEEFYEHGGFGHGGTLWNELLHVPLVVKPDRRDGETIASRRLAERVRTLDLLPTLLARLGVAAPAEEAMGVDLAAAFGAGELPELPVIAEEEPDKRCLLSGRLKYVVYGPASSEPGRHLFDLVADPKEQNDLAAAQPELGRRMDGELARILADYAARGFTPIRNAAQQRLGAADLQALKRLGYVGNDGDAPDAAGTPDGRKKKPAANDDDDR